MDESNKIVSSSLKSGIVLGITLMLFTAIIYISDIHLFSISSGIVMLVVVFGGEIAFSIFSAKKLRTEFGGKITFVQVIINIFILLFIASLINAIFTYVLYNFIDVDYLSMQVEYFAEDMSTMISENQMEETLATLDEKVLEMKSLGGLLMKSWIGPLVMSLILSLFIKKDINE